MTAHKAPMNQPPTTPSKWTGTYDKRRETPKVEERENRRFRIESIEFRFEPLQVERYLTVSRRTDLAALVSSMFVRKKNSDRTPTIYCFTRFSRVTTFPFFKTANPGWCLRVTSGCDRASDFNAFAP